MQDTLNAMKAFLSLSFVFVTYTDYVQYFTLLWLLFFVILGIIRLFMGSACPQMSSTLKAITERHLVDQSLEPDGHC